MTGGAGGFGVFATVAVAVPIHLIHVQVVPMDVGGDIAEVEAFRSFVAEPGGNFVHSKGIARGWGIAVGEECVAVARGQTHPVGFTVTHITLRIIRGLIAFAGGDGDIQAAHCQPFRLLEVVGIGNVAVGNAIEVDVFRCLEMANRAL